MNIQASTALRRPSGAAGLFNWTAGSPIPVDAAFGFHVRKERTMTIFSKPRIAIFVDKPSQQWIVQDPEGYFWAVPVTENPWENRQPFSLSEETELEPVPGHYKYVLGLPF